MSGPISISVLWELALGRTRPWLYRRGRVFSRPGCPPPAPQRSAWGLTPATVAAEAEGLLAEIAAEVEREKAKRNAESARDQHAGLGKKLPDPKPDDQKTATKAAALFGTNRTYVNQAVPPVDGTGGKRK